MNGEIISLHHWFNTPPGRHALQWEQERFDELVADVFGYHALQLGMPRLAGLRANRMPHRWMALDQAQAMILEQERVADRARHRESFVQPQPTALLTEPVMLPFAEQSIDLVLMPHSLEVSQDPHAALREVERVLMPEGRVIISGFNPYSLWGLRQSRTRLYRRLGVGGDWYLPREVDSLAPGRLKDWLRLLGLELDSISFGCYRPAAASGAWLDNYAWMDGLGARWWPIWGAAYVIVAVKRVQGMRLMGPSWRKSPQKAPSPAQVPVTHKPVQSPAGSHPFSSHQE